MQLMKEQGKNPPYLINEEEIGSLPEKEFRIMLVKMIQNLGYRIEKIPNAIYKRPTSEHFARFIKQICLTGCSVDKNPHFITP